MDGRKTSLFQSESNLHFNACLVNNKVQVCVLAVGVSLARLSNRWNKFSLAPGWEGARVAVAGRWAARLLGLGCGGLAHRHICIAPHVLGGAADGEGLRDTTGTAAALASGTIELQAVSLHALTIGNQISAAQFTALATLCVDGKGKGLLEVCDAIA